jgi:dienelactone hydrolase
MKPIAKSRRQFLESLGLATTAGLAADGEGRGDPPPSAARLGPADTPRVLRPSGAELGNLYPEIEKLAAANRYAYSFLGDRFRDLPAFQAETRSKIFDLLLYHPEPVQPKAEVIERVDRGDHVREKIVFSTAPTFRVPAYVLVPKKVRKPAPAIIDLHSHGGMFLFGKEKVIDLGDNHPALVEYHRRNYDGRPTATALVRRGYIVISIDALMFGERRVLMDADLKYGWDRSRYGPEEVQHLNRQCASREATLVKGLTLAGLTWPGIVFWDDIRTIDYLVSRPEVDAKRIGCLGISMGGYRSLYLAGLDERIKSACVTGFLSSVRPMIRSHLDTHSWIHFLPALHRYLDLPDAASLAAPRPLLVQQCARDRLFPAEGMKEAIKKIAAVYDKAGAKDKFSGRFYDVPHVFSKAMQDEAFDWLDRHLKG